MKSGEEKIFPAFFYRPENSVQYGVQYGEIL